MRPYFSFLLISILALSGCASERYLTAEEDAQMKADCEAKGCTIVHNDVMQAILKRLQETRI